MYTSSYNNFNTELYKGLSISIDKGKTVNFKGEYCDFLAPKKSFWKVWKNNKKSIDEQVNNEYYIREYYLQVLSKLDPNKIYNKLYNSFLLCYEDSHEFCHRHIIVAWLELFLNIKVKEVKVDGLFIEEVQRPEYIKDILEKIIKENTNMRGFNSLRALYLFNLGDELEIEADKKEIEFNKSYASLRQAAAYLRSEADMEEDEYNNSVKVKKLVNNE